LLSARDPWSGFIHYDAGLQILRHFSWFAKIGWENPDNTAGIWRVVAAASATGATGTNPVNGRNGTPSYLTLAAPDKRDFSVVLINDSEQPRTYQLRAVNMTYAESPALELWETRAANPRRHVQRQLHEVPLHAVGRRRRSLPGHGPALLADDRHDTGQHGERRIQPTAARGGSSHRPRHRRDGSVSETSEGSCMPTISTTRQSWCP
jgi:hypothetical protein